MFFDPMYLLMLAPALLLAFWAQYRVKTAYAQAQQQPANLSGAAAARHILDSAGLTDVNIETVPGSLTDHYDPREKVLRLSTEVYQSRTLAAVGIAAHESGHAIQDARHYAPLYARNAIVPMAGFGTNFSWILFIIGMLMHYGALIYAGIGLFGAVVVFQLVNLPCEFNASARAKAQFVSLGIVPEQQMTYVNDVLNAAALTYVAATLQSILTLLYLIMRANGSSRR
jgi:hypothetical protein